MAGLEGRNLTLTPSHNTTQEVLDAAHYIDGDNNVGFNVFPLGFRAPKTPTIKNITINNTSWTEVIIPQGCCAWMLQARTENNILYAYTTAPTEYMTLKSGRSLSEDTDIYATKLYLKADIASLVVELEIWIS